MHTKDYRYVSPECGHVGSPTKATKEKGAKELDWIADWISKIIKRDFVS
jgi:creatinine amidohydrolase/Fe(II)-dependent formamide hydrolase-like protein